MLQQLISLAGNKEFAGITFSVLIMALRLTTTQLLSPQFYESFRNTRRNIAIKLTALYTNYLAGAKQQIACKCAWQMIYLLDKNVA